MFLEREVIGFFYQYVLEWTIGFIIMKLYEFVERTCRQCNDGAPGPHECKLDFGGGDGFNHASCCGIGTP